MSFLGAFLLTATVVVVVMRAIRLKAKQLGEPASHGWAEAASRVNLTVLKDDKLQTLVKRERVHVDVRRREQGGRQIFNTLVRVKAPPVAAALTIRGESRWTRVRKLVNGEDVLVHDEDFDRRVHVQGDVATVVSLLDESIRSALLLLVERDGGELEGGELRVELPGVVKDSRRLAAVVENLVALRKAMTVDARVIDDRLAQNATHERRAEVRLRNLELLVVRDGKGPLTRTTATKLLRDRDGRVRLAAARLLLDGDSFHALGELVQSHSHPALREEALALLLEYWSYGQCRPLIEVALRTGTPGLGVIALGAVVRARDASHLPLVARCAGRDDPKLTAGAAHALGELGDASHEQILLPLLARESDEVKLAAVRALGLIGTVASVEPLLPLTSGLRLPGAVKEAARDSIRRIQSRIGPVESGRLSLIGEHESSGGLSLSLEGGGLSLEAEAAKGRAKQRE